MLIIKSNGVILQKTDLPFENKAVLNPAYIKLGNIIHTPYRAISKINISSISYCQLSGKKLLKDLISLFCIQNLVMKKGREDPGITFIDSVC